MMRIASYRIHCSLVSKPVKIEEYWALPTDKKQGGKITRAIVDAEMLAIINKAHGTNFKFKTNGSS